MGSINSTIMNNTKINWTQYTWNPITGCDWVSDACDHCYARSMAKRLQGANNPLYKNGFKVTLHYDKLYDPREIKNKEGSMVFVCSMSDLFHKDVPFDFIDKVFSTIIGTPKLTYQILTKRTDRMAEYFSTRPVPENAWIGTTVENKAALNRVEILKKIDASVRWLSCEPLLEDLTPAIDLVGIDWVVVGGESGQQSRAMKEDWVWNLKQAATNSGTAFFFKQWGSIGQDGVRRSKKDNGNLLKGKSYMDYPRPRKLN